MRLRSDNAKPNSPIIRDIKTLVVRVRDIDQPYGTGQGIAFSGDKLDGNDPEHVTALDKLATWLSIMMDGEVCDG